MFKLAFAALTLLRLVAAHPTAEAATVDKRCGVNGLVPQSIYFLNEGAPNTVIQSANQLFQVSQNAGATNRTYTLVTFHATPAGSYGCQLGWKLDPTLQFVTKTGASQVDVEQTMGFIPPYAPTWNNIIAANPPVTLGVSGTVNANAGTSSTINTYTCSNADNGYGLAFVFKLPQWVEQGGSAASISFFLGQEMQTYTNVFIDYNC